MKEITFQRLKMLARLLTCLLLIFVVAAQRSRSLSEQSGDGALPQAAAGDSAITSANGVTLINTTSIASHITGFSGPTPLEITIVDNKIANVRALYNAETPSFFNRVESELLPRWTGVPVSEVAAMQVDGVTGATYSSRAVNATVKAGIAYYQGGPVESLPAGEAADALSVKVIATIGVILCAAILPLFVRSRRYRRLQLVANVAVLGLWSGTFLSHELFVGLMSGAMPSVAIMLLLAVAFLFPYFGRKSHYCTWVCPLGSLQELAGTMSKRKLNMSPRLVRALTLAREVLWAALIAVMCAGMWFEWMHWELFTAFLFRQAAPAVLVAAGAFVALSVVVNRPYCRFVCPTGTLVHIAQGDKFTPNK